VSLLVVGSVAFDSVKTPYGSVDRVLAGAGTYFALAASFFTDVRVVAVVGEDFTATEEKVFLNRGIDITGIAHAKGKSFFWAGEYGENVNEAKTLDTQLGVFADFNPQIPAKFKKTEYVFLANIDPVLQVNVRKQVDGAKFVGGDTMNYWINGSRPQLAEFSSGSTEGAQHGAQGAGGQARRIWRYRVLSGRSFWNWQASVPGANLAH